MTQEHTESTDIQDALNPLTDEGTDAVDPKRATQLVSRVTDGFRSGTLPIAGGGLLLYGAVKQLRNRRGRAILQAIAGASLLTVGLRQRKASKSQDEWDPLKGDQGVSDAPGTADDLGESTQKTESGLDAGAIADEVSSELSDRVPISGGSESESEGEGGSESQDESSGDAELDTDEQLDVHVTGAPGSGDPEFGEESDDADRQGETDAASNDERTDDEGTGDEQLGQDETDVDADADAGDDDGMVFGGSIEDERESDEDTTDDELSEENEDKDEDIRGP